MAEVARALARQLDQACGSDSARGLSASPPIARRLVEVVGTLNAVETEAEMPRGAAGAEEIGGELGREGGRGSQRE